MSDYCGPTSQYKTCRGPEGMHAVKIPAKPDFAQHGAKLAGSALVIEKHDHIQQNSLWIAPVAEAVRVRHSKNSDLFSCKYRHSCSLVWHEAK